MTVSASGIEPGQRQLNNIKTTGREYRNVTEPSFEIDRTNDVGIQTRDGTTLLADVYRPVAAAKFPALVSFSPYPRQIQDLGAPVGFIEAGATDFFVPRGYVQVIANARGTGGSEGAYWLFDHQEWQDIADVIEWAAAQPLMISQGRGNASRVHPYSDRAAQPQHSVLQLAVAAAVAGSCGRLTDACPGRSDYRPAIPAPTARHDLITPWSSCPTRASRTVPFSPTSIQRNSEAGHRN